MGNYFSIPLSPMSGGVNRFEPEAKKDQSVDALNVTNDDGYLRRRDAFNSIALGVPHHLPKGAVFVLTSDAAVSEAFADLRSGFGTVGSSSIKRFYIGCPETFDGISWGKQAVVSISSAINIEVTAHYSSDVDEAGLAWTSVPTLIDKTRTRAGSGLVSLTQDGQIGWHKGDLAGWITLMPAEIYASTGIDAADLGSLGGLYWIRLDIVSGGVNVQLPTGTSIVTPGIRAFHLQPINGLFPVTIGGRQTTVVCSDRSRAGGAVAIRAFEPGAQIGLISGPASSTDPALIVEDEGLGVYDKRRWPAWNVPSTLLTATGTYLGESEFLIKSYQTTEWEHDPLAGEPLFGQFRGSPLVEGLSPTALSTTKIVRFPLSQLDPAPNQYDHCRLRFTDAAGSSNPTGNDAEIWMITKDSSVAYVHVYEEFAFTPSVLDEFAIISPNCVARMESMSGSSGEFEIGEHSTAHGHGVRFTLNSRAQTPSADLVGEHVNFQIGREARWSITGSKRYSGVYSSATKKLFILGPSTPLLDVDGSRVRRAVADTTSETAKAISGEIKKSEEAATGFTLSAKTFLRTSPPDGDFIVDHRGRLIIARAETNEISYNWPSMPDIWPVGYTFHLRDAENNRITGMATLHDNLIVFTATAMFVCTLGSGGYFSVRPVVQGVGFTSHAAVQKIVVNGSSALLGPGTDGVYMFNGGEPVVVLDDWSRLIAGGVNRGRLDDAVAAVSFTKNLYLLAVPSEGSEVNDRIIVFDYLRKNWWVWAHPRGVSFLATDFDAEGQEQVLIGSVDGHIEVLRNALDDDSLAVTGSARTVPKQPFGDAEGSFVGVLGHYGELGAGRSVTLKSFTEKKADSASSATVALDSRKVSAETDTWTGGKEWGDDRLLPRRTNLPTQTKGSLVSIEVSGADRWSLRNLTLLARRMGRRGRR